MVDGQTIDQEWLNILGEAEDEAAAGQEKVNFGKLSVTPRYLQWAKNEGGSRAPVEVAISEYKGLGARDRSIEVVLEVDIQEFSPDLNWQYVRRVLVGSQDWFAIFKPSVEGVFGEGSMESDTMGKTLSELREKYVQGADVLQAPTKKNPEPEFRTFSLVKVYESREECLAERDARFGTSDDDASASGSDDDWADFDLAEEVEAVGDLIDSGEYEGLDAIAADYYGVEPASLIGMLNSGGLSVPQIAKLDKAYTAKSVKAALGE